MNNQKITTVVVGPYITTKIKGNNVYEVSIVDKGTIKAVLNHSELKPYYG